MKETLLIERRTAPRRRRVSPGRRALEVDEFLKSVAALRAHQKAANAHPRIPHLLRPIAIQSVVLLVVGSLCFLLHRTLNRKSALRTGPEQAVFSPSGTFYLWSGFHRVGPGSYR